MRDPIRLENIEEMRRLQGIDDVELRDKILGLAVGDLVKVTFLTSTDSSETMLVRITSINGAAFHGKLSKKPTLSGLAKLRAGSLISFTAAHIHSIAREFKSTT